MVLPTILKKRHTLKERNLLPVVKRIRTGKPGSLKDFARISKEIKTDTLSLDEIDEQVQEITGEQLDELLTLARRDSNIEEARWALHCIILYCNEYGQPRGQDLSEETPAASTSSGTTPSNKTAPDSLSVSKKAGEKRKRDPQDDSESLEDRIASLEKSTRVEVLQELKEKVRALCLQAEPSIPLILLTLEELAKVARRAGNEEAEMFEELARQAIRHQAKLDISSLCLSVLGGKAADVISKAISKCMKTDKSESQKRESKSPQKENSPLFNAYPALAQNPFAFQHFQQAPMSNNWMYRGFNGGYRGRSRPYNPQRPRGPCHFCGDMSHTIRDCSEMKAAKESKFNTKK